MVQGTARSPPAVQHGRGERRRLQNGSLPGCIPVWLNVATATAATSYVVQQRFGGCAYSRLEIIPVAIIQGDAVARVDGRGG